MCRTEVNIHGMEVDRELEDRIMQKHGNEYHRARRDDEIAARIQVMPALPLSILSVKHRDRCLRLVHVAAAPVILPEKLWPK